MDTTCFTGGFDPGRYPGIPNDVYQRAPGISKSRLSHMDCPLKSRRIPKPPTDAVVFGTVVHTAILEPERIESDIVVLPEDINLRTNAGKQQLQELKDAHPGSPIIRPDVMDKARYMRDAVWSHPEANRLLSMRGTAEESHFWFDERTGELCKARTDYLRDDGVIVDLKKVANASPWAFSRAVWDYKYHWQDAWYQRGVGSKDFIFLCIEDDEIDLGTKKTYAVELYDLTSRLRRQGLHEVDAALDRYLVCRELDDWPTYNDNDRVNKLDIPAYAQQGGTWDEPDMD